MDKEIKNLAVEAKLIGCRIHTDRNGRISFIADGIKDTIDFFHKKLNTFNVIRKLEVMYRKEKDYFENQNLVLGISFTGYDQEANENQKIETNHSNMGFQSKFLDRFPNLKKNLTKGQTLPQVDEIKELLKAQIKEVINNFLLSV